MTLAASVVISAIMLLEGREILGLFIPDDATDKQAVLVVAYKYLSVMSLTLSALYMLHLLRSVLQGLGNAVIPMCAGILEFVMRVAAALVLPKLIGNDGIFYAETLAWVGAIVLMIPAYFITMKKLSMGRRKGELI